MGSTLATLRQTDPDELFAYQTQKMVLVKDRWLGLLRIAFQSLIFIYVIVVVLILQKKYLEYEVPVGVSYSTFQKPNANIDVTKLPYCGQYTGTQSYTDRKPCVFWDAYESNYPDQLSITTRTSITNEVRQCTGAVTSCNTIWVNTSVPSELYVAAVDTFTLRIQHSFQARVFYSETSDSRYSRSSSQMSGTLKNYEGKVVRSLSVGQFDQFSISELVAAAGADLSNDADTFGTPPGTESQRHSGIIISITIMYENALSDQPYYTYFVNRIPQTEYKIIELRMSGQDQRVNVNRHGIKLLITQSGQIGRFSFQVMLLQLVTSLGLLSVATLVVDNIMLYVMPFKKWYIRYKFQETIDFSDVKDTEDANYRVMSDDEFAASIHKDLAKIRGTAPAAVPVGAVGARNQANPMHAPAAAGATQTNTYVTL